MSFLADGRARICIVAKRLKAIVFALPEKRASFSALLIRNSPSIFLNRITLDQAG